MSKLGTSARIQDIDVYLEYEVTMEKDDTVLLAIYLPDMLQNIIEVVNEDFLSNCEIHVNYEAYTNDLLID